MSFIINTVLAIVGGLSFGFTPIFAVGFFSSLYGLSVGGYDKDDLRMIRDSSAFMFIICATTAYFTF